MRKKRATSNRPTLHVRLDEGRIEKVIKIAQYRGFDKSNVVRLMIDAEYAKLPPEAK